MPYLSLVVGRVHLLRWVTPTYPDVESVRLEILAAARAAKRPLVCLGVIPNNMAPPDDRTRQAMMGNMQDIVASSEIVHFVVEGTGFGTSIMRSVLAGILLFGGKRGKVIIHAKVDEALAQFPLDIDRRLVTTRGQEKGIIPDLSRVASAG
jgi:hypothetical protein